MYYVTKISYQKSRDKVNARQNVYFMFFSSILHVLLAFKNDCK